MFVVNIIFIVLMYFTIKKLLVKRMEEHFKEIKNKIPDGENQYELLGFSSTASRTSTEFGAKCDYEHYDIPRSVVYDKVN